MTIKRVLTRKTHKKKCKWKQKETPVIHVETKGKQHQQETTTATTTKVSHNKQRQQQQQWQKKKRSDNSNSLPKKWKLFKLRNKLFGKLLEIYTVLLDLFLKHTFGDILKIINCPFAPQAAACWHYQPCDPGSNSWQRKDNNFMK